MTLQDFTQKRQPPAGDIHQDRAEARDISASRIDSDQSSIGCGAGQRTRSKEDCCSLAKGLADKYGVKIASELLKGSKHV